MKKNDFDLILGREENIEYGASQHDIWKRYIGSTIFYQFIVNFTYFSGFIGILSFYLQYITIIWGVK